MIERENVTMTSRELIQMYDEWQNGRITKKSYTQYLLKRLEKTIKKIVDYNAFAGIDATEDLFQEAYLYVCDHVDNYNPRKGRLSSYFFKGIKGCISDFIRNSEQFPLSSHYRYMTYKLETYAEQNAYSNFDEIPEKELQKINISSVVAGRCKEYQKRICVNIEDLDEQEFFLPSPEEILCETEFLRFVKKYVKGLPQMEQYILLKRLEMKEEFDAREVAKEFCLSVSDVKDAIRKIQACFWRKYNAFLEGNLDENQDYIMF